MSFSFTEIVFGLIKKKGIYIFKPWLRGKGGHSEFADLSSTLEKITFWWIGYCARDCFKHSEANWRLLPTGRLFSEALRLEAGKAPDLHVQIPKWNASTNWHSTSVLLPISSRFSRTIGWALTESHVIILNRTS